MTSELYKCELCKQEKELLYNQFDEVVSEFCKCKNINVIQGEKVLDRAMRILNETYFRSTSKSTKTI
jgi:hypothetical protein